MNNIIQRINLVWPFQKRAFKKTKDGFEVADWAWEGAFDEELVIDRGLYVNNFRPEEQGALDGAELIPPSEADSPSEFENKLRDTIDTDMQRQIGKRLSVLGRVEAELEKTTIDDPNLEIRKIKDDLTAIEIPRIIERNTPDLLEKKIAAGYAERSYHLFKTIHQRLEEPKDKRSIEYDIMIIIALIIIEGGINMSFFKESLEFGLLDAGFITFSVAAVNVVLSLLAGHTMGKATHYIKRFWVRKTLGCIGSVLYFLSISALHLGFGVYRNIVDENQSTAQAAAEVVPRIYAIIRSGDWIGLFGGMGTILAAIGIAFAAIAFYEGMAAITDQYPGYAAIKRRTIRRLVAFKNAWDDTKDEIEDAFENAIETLNKMLAENERKLMGFKRRAREFTQLANIHRREITRAEMIFQSLIKAYRDANKAHREGVPTPVFFDVPPTMLEQVPLYDGVRLDEAQQELMRDFEQAKEKILDAKVDIENEKQKEYKALAMKLSDIEGRARDRIAEVVPKIHLTSSEKFEF